MRWYVAENVERSGEDDLSIRRWFLRKNEGLRVEGTDGVGFGTNKVA